jgi:hypothetical protein
MSFYKWKAWCMNDKIIIWRASVYLPSKKYTSKAAPTAKAPTIMRNIPAL